MKQNESGKKKFNQSRMSRGFSPSKSICSEFSQSSNFENGGFKAVNNLSNKLDFNEFKNLLSVIASSVFPDCAEDDSYLALISVLLSLNFQKYKQEGEQ
jgi:hypothetical protein